MATLDGALKLYLTDWHHAPLVLTPGVSGLAEPAENASGLLRASYQDHSNCAPRQ